MNGRFPSGLYVEVFDGLPNDSEDSLTNRFEALAAHPGMDHALRYEGLSGSGTHVLMFETERWDMEDLPRELDAEMPLPSSVGESVSLRGIYRRCGPSLRPSKSGFIAEGAPPDPVTGVLMTLSRYRAAIDTSHYVTSDDATEFEFNKWYNGQWLPGELEWGTVKAGYRFASAEADSTGKRSYIALYETDDSVPADAIGRHMSLRTSNPPTDPFRGAEFGRDYALRPQSLVAAR